MLTIAFEAKLAGVREHGRAVVRLKMLDKLDAVAGPAQQALQSSPLRCISGSRRRSTPVKLEQVEAEKLHLAVVLARVKAVEVGHAVGAQDHALSVEHAGAEADGAALKFTLTGGDKAYEFNMNLN